MVRIKIVIAKISGNGKNISFNSSSIINNIKTKKMEESIKLLEEYAEENG